MSRRPAPPSAGPPSGCWGGGVAHGGRRAGGSADHTPLPDPCHPGRQPAERARLPGDWDPGCAQTGLAPTGDEGGLREQSSRVPRGLVRVQGALNGSWDENYGARRRPADGEHPAGARPATPSSASPTTTPPTRSTVAPGAAAAARLTDADRRPRRHQPARGPHPRALLLRHGRPVRERRPANDTGGIDRRPAGARLRPDRQGLLPRRRPRRPHRAARLHRGPRAPPRSG